MTVYFVVLFLCIVLAYAAEKKDLAHENSLSYGTVDHSPNTRTLFILLALVLIIVSGLRYNVGGDFWNYYDSGERNANAFFESLKTLDEPGFKFIYWLVRQVTTERIVPVFIFAAITMSLMLRVIYKHTDKLLMAVLLFLFIGCWHESFNAVRQCFAAAIVFSGYRFIQEKKFFLYAIIIVIAFLFHRSALLMILPYFVYHIRVSPKNILLLILGVLVVMYSYDRLFSISEWVLNERTLSSTEYANRSVNIFRTIVAVAPALYYLLITIGSKRDKTQEFYINVLIIHATVMVITSQSALLGRFGIYTAPFCVLAIAELNKLEATRIRFSSGYSISTGVVICLLFFAYWIYDIAIDVTVNHYLWVWNR